MMKQLLIKLKELFESSSFISYIKFVDIVDIEERIKTLNKISISKYPLILIGRGGENVATGAQDRIIKRLTIDLLVVQRYDKIETVILGDHNTKGITEITDDIENAISENPTLNNFARGWDPGTLRIEEGFLQGNFSAYTAGRRMAIDFFKLKAINSG